MLTIHHLRRSQSERIIWLCEELGIEYELKCYDRSPQLLAPPELKALSPIEQAPVLEDEGGIYVFESGAIIEYILARHDGSRLQIPATPDARKFADYLFWMHLANASVQPLMNLNMTIRGANVPEEHPLAVVWITRLHGIVALMNTRLETSQYLLGDFTAADIFNVFSLSTMRLFYPLDLSPYPNVVRYLDTVGRRPAYMTAMAKGDPGFVPALAGSPPVNGLL